MQNAFPPSKTYASWGLRLLLVGGAAIAFALLGPFGTYDAMTLSARFFYWFVLLAAADACIRFAHRIVERFGLVTGYAGRLGQSAFCFTAIFSPHAWGLNGFFDASILDLTCFIRFAGHNAAHSGT